MKPMAILHTESSLGWGGQEIRILTEAKGVARRGHEVVLAAPPEARIFAEAPRFEVTAIALPIARKGVRAMLAVRRLLASRAFDVVNTHSSVDTWSTALACATLSRRPPIVRTRHISAPIPGNAGTRWLYTRATDRIVTTGERLREQLIRETGVDPRRVRSIPTGIDLDRFRPGDRREARRELALPPDRPIVGIVATLRSWKGHRYLLEALAGMDPAVMLAIVGDGPQLEALTRLAAELAVEGRVLFGGNHADVAPWMRAFDLFCLPSYANEGVPQSLMQAMACGLAVVTTPVGSIEEIVSHERTGILVAPRDAAALRAALQSLLADDARRSAIGERAATEARERFGEARMVEGMLEVFSDASGRRHG